MGSTNKTVNYELSQYIGTDKPSWLNDYNNDMLKIDTQMKANATAAGNAQSTATAADGKADANTESISTLNTQINTPSTGLAAIVAGHTTDIASINGVIGDTPLTTVAQTLTGAIEEVKTDLTDDISSIEGNVSEILTALATKVSVKKYTVSSGAVLHLDSTELPEAYLIATKGSAGTALSFFCGAGYGATSVRHATTSLITSAEITYAVDTDAYGLDITNSTTVGINVAVIKLI